MSGQTINVISAPNASDANAATFTVDASTGGSISYPDNIVFSDGVVKITGLVNSSYSTATSDLSYDYTGSALNFYGRGGLAESIPFVDQSPDQGTHLEVAQLGNAFYVTEGTLHEPAGATTLNGTAVAPTPPPKAPIALAVHDDTTGTQPSGATTPYTGPVAGIEQQFSLITPDNLNITTFADNLFIKTGAGNDAIALHGGTNVVDAGGGSNFLVGGGSEYTTPHSSFDTFFLDARNIAASSSAAGPVPGAIWDTIQGFDHGDAATLFGVGSGTAFAWARNEGAAGHTGLTLHALEPNGSTASLTLAGIDNGSHLQLSFGNTGGSSYLYVKAI